MIVLRVREVAEQKGVSMHKLSRMADVNLTTLQRIYHDENYNLTLQTLDKLANALDVHPSELFEYTQNEKS